MAFKQLVVAGVLSFWVHEYEGHVWGQHYFLCRERFLVVGSAKGGIIKEDWNTSGFFNFLKIIWINLK